VLTSSGAFLSHISVLNVDGSSTTSHGFYFKLVAEIFAERLIADSVTEKGFVIDDCTRSYYDNLFALTCGSDGIYITGNSETIRCDNTISQSNTGYGIKCDSSSPTPNYFFRLYTDANAAGETDVRGIDTVEHLKGYVEHNRLAIPNNLSLRMIDSGGTPRAILQLGGDDILRLFSPVGHLHINPAATQPTLINYDTTQDVHVGSDDAVDRPSKILLHASTDAYLKIAGTPVYSTDGTYFSLNAMDLLLDTGDAGKKLKFGTDVEIYRSAANTLLTPDNFTALNINATGVFKVDGVQVLTNQQAHIADVAVAGTAEDGTCRTKVNELIALFETMGFTASS